MAIDTRTPEGRQRELRNASLLQLKRNIERALDELNYLIMSTETGERRNAITDINIHMMAAADGASKLGSEES